MQKVKPILIILVIILSVLGLFYVVSIIRNIGQPKYNIRANSKTVITEIRSLSRLETSQFTIEKVIDAGTTQNRLSELLFGDRLLLIAHGSVIAGFDLSKVNDSDVKVTDATLRITLPAPQILVTHLDSDQTRVYDRQTGILSKGDKDLESNARAEAEKLITQAACEGGILAEASKNARNQLTTLFKGMNFSTVIFTIPQGKC